MATSQELSSNYVTFKRRLWLGPRAKSVLINTNNDWFIVNHKQTGFYRVNYDTDSWRRLIHVLDSPEFESIHVLNRAQIVDDLFNLARAGYVQQALMMNATKYLVRETSHLPWKAFFNGLTYVYERFEGQSYQNHLAKYVSNLMNSTYNKVGFEDRPADQLLDELHREMVLQWACKINKTECVQKSINLFAIWQQDMLKW